MSIVRPELAAALVRWREVIAAGAAGLAGLWIATRGGPVLAAAGGAVVLLALAWAVNARRRMRFAQAVAAPGIVEVVEGEVAYLGPAFGGHIALSELAEIRLVTMRGRRLWRLMQTDGTALLIPVDAAGAERLFDAFAALPGMDTGALVAALAPPPGTGAPGLLAAGPQMRTVWRRPGAGLART
jgi:hypothetical protein